MDNTNWYIVILTVVTMTVVGFSTFDSTTSALIFGVGTGGIFGWVISSIVSKKSSEEE
ncbi:hypothetical protein [Planomicrobium sp. YIM 101495]|uniref:hypothetical protein n=1 Tax=Planomicrobium sp. YIM 101495 TaxID=2665160 RepID=UPI0012B8B2EE|nr:hypothetical protein [Planomicrobium sp. YIM 101495]MTD31245.1 hypothetical protein [Planomicrobium sp. YIM 101495]